MPLVLAGIDEAGYGPTLGPLCIGASVLRIAHDAPDGKTPDLWELLARGVCREPARGGTHDKKGRVAVADSKRLKLANSVKTTHPLIHLERGVLAFASCLASGGECATDEGLFRLLGAGLGDHSCYQSPARPLPVSLTEGEVSIAKSVLSAALTGAGVEVVDLACEIVCEDLFNRTVRDLGNKAETTALGVGSHMRRVWERWGAEPDTRLGIVCDRLGGRAAYAGLLERELEGASVEIVEESDQRSRYIVREMLADGRERKAGVAFLVEAESAHLPVALASMIAKFVRELSMLRFNAYWSGVHRENKGSDIRPTAGYAQDARRWLDEIGDALTSDDRRRLVRVL